MPQINASFSRTLIDKVKKYADERGISFSEAVEIHTQMANLIIENPSHMVKYIVANTAKFMSGLTKKEHAMFVKIIKIENTSLLKP